MLSTPPSFNAHHARRAPPREPAPPRPGTGFPRAYGPTPHGHDYEPDAAYDYACAAHDRGHEYPVYDGHGHAYMPRSGRAPLGVATLSPDVPLPALRGTPTTTRSATTTDPAFDAPPSGTLRATALARHGQPPAPALGPAVATGGGAAATAAALAWPSAADDTTRGWPPAPRRAVPAPTAAAPSAGAQPYHALPRARAAFGARSDGHDDERRAYYPPPPPPCATAAAPWRGYDDTLPPAAVSGAHYHDAARPVPPRYPAAWANALPPPTRPRATALYDHYAPADHDQGLYDLPPPAPTHDDGRYDALPPPALRTRTHSRGSESLDRVRTGAVSFARPPRSSETAPAYHTSDAHDGTHRPPSAISPTWRSADVADMDVGRVPPTWSRPGRDRPTHPSDPYALCDAYRAPPTPTPHPWAEMRRALPPPPPLPEEYYPHHYHYHSYPEHAPTHRSGRYWLDEDPCDASVPSRPMSWPIPPLPPSQQDPDRSPSGDSVPRIVPPPSLSSAPGPSPTTAHARPETMAMPMTSGSRSGSGSNQASSTSTAPPATIPGGYFFDEENDHMVISKRREFFVFNRAYYTTMVLCLQNKAPIPRDVEIRRWKRLMKSLTLLPNYETEPFRCLAWTGGNLAIAPVEDWAAILSAVHVDSAAGVHAHRSMTQTCKVLGAAYQMRRSRCGIPSEYVEAYCRRCTGCRTITPAAAAAVVVTVPAAQEGPRGEHGVPVAERAA
ncbi:hypothetical protein AMAG_01444 [Allomyces macrogynus ATCC 38327]|uniref:Uncharacterized protein n=1 Tax=Allomyces macrogynus (strain ATCC 38327) TaxID=578462 RepID=A0A0L0RZS3_ALLM3|nr:hypothetical protein AMAG_01444 [Allomyces macrogynus ATCC 38327]|eukprot:KNE55554.1 hypothetical protein AMAG_01444 [Allomyces macrogynus ATCC 38327]